MLRSFGPSTIIAILIGSFIAFLAFIPVVAYRYRKNGRLRFLDLLELIGVAVYSVALWSYTLIPIPESPDYACARSNFVPFEFVHDILADGHTLLHNRALFQVLFNVALFIPLGAFVRILFKRGVLVATAVGFVVSALIETTQLTGLWWLYPCAYRTFDVDDLMANTLGALCGSLLILPLIQIAKHGHQPAKLDRVSAGRRIVGVLADLIVIYVTGFTAAIGTRAVELYLLDVKLDDVNVVLERILTVGVPLVLEGLMVLLRGQTAGEWVVDIRPVFHAKAGLAQRVGKLLFGVGGYILLANLGDGHVGFVYLVFVLVSVVCIFVPKDHRGLTGLLTKTSYETRSPGDNAGATSG
ncbi:MAG: VanZ family protein [Propionibacteriaceae bacterium]|jgi:glycopeptide antibiotics resistance protein|nr:VanZ family protein [Propionibacteriaceae bacterium]